MFFRKLPPKRATSHDVDFPYLSADTYYFDSACQTLRPQVVIDAEIEYYTHYNACGGRVKYPWGIRTDDAVTTVRQQLLTLVGKSAKDYTVVFTLNTTYGINLVLQQLPATAYTQITTSDIEHNSVFLPTITWAKRHNVPRNVLPRGLDGSLQYDVKDIKQAVVLVNTASNIDGRELHNAPELAKDIHKHGGILLLDAAQSFGHNVELLAKTDFDAAFGSGHKMYGPSIGFIIIKKSLVKSLDTFLTGGGTVKDVQLDSFTLVDNDAELYARLELGLQNWAGIIGLGAAITWMQSQKKPEVTEYTLGKVLFTALQAMPKVHLINTEPSATISFYTDTIDAHQLALYLGEQRIMCRSGYFCCHYYLHHLKHMPPLLRVSLGRQSSLDQVQHFISTLSIILQNL